MLNCWRTQPLTIRSPPLADATVFNICSLLSEETDCKAAHKPNNATHIGGEALRKLFKDRFTLPSEKRICLEVARSFLKYQIGTDYMTQKKIIWVRLLRSTLGYSRNTLPIDLHMEFILEFASCFSKYMILVVPTKEHTAVTICNALLDSVVPYFGVPWCLLSDREVENLQVRFGQNPWNSAITHVPLPTRG